MGTSHRRVTFPGDPPRWSVTESASNSRRITRIVRCVRPARPATTSPTAQASRQPVGRWPDSCAVAHPRRARSTTVGGSTSERRVGRSRSARCRPGEPQTAQPAPTGSSRAQSSGRGSSRRDRRAVRVPPRRAWAPMYVYFHIPPPHIFSEAASSALVRTLRFAQLASLCHTLTTLESTTISGGQIGPLTSREAFFADRACSAYLGGAWNSRRSSTSHRSS